MSSVSYASGCSCCGGGPCVLYVMFVFLFLDVRVGDVVEAVGCKGRAPPPPPPVLASLSSSVCLSLLLNVGMASVCICGRCLGKSGHKRSSLYVFAIFLARLMSAVGACYICVVCC